VNWHGFAHENIYFCHKEYIFNVGPHPNLKTYPCPCHSSTLQATCQSRLNFDLQIQNEKKINPVWVSKQSPSGILKLKTAPPLRGDSKLKT
jgi:hypothetical protein